MDFSPARRSQPARFYDFTERVGVINRQHQCVLWPGSSGKMMPCESCGAARIGARGRRKLLATRSGFAHSTTADTASRYYRECRYYGESRDPTTSGQPSSAEKDVLSADVAASGRLTCGSSTRCTRRCAAGTGREFAGKFRAACRLTQNFGGIADLIAEGDYVVGQWEGGGTHTGEPFDDMPLGALPATPAGDAVHRRHRPAGRDGLIAESRPRRRRHRAPPARPHRAA